MAIPDFASVMLPLLKIAGDGSEHSIRETISALADQFKLSDAEKKELLPSGGDWIFDNRVGWARTYLKKAGLIEYPRRGHFQITELGREALRKNPSRIDVKFLRQFPEFVEYYGAPKKSVVEQQHQEQQEAGGKTPEDLLASGYLELRKQIETDLLARVKACPPEFFERLVVRLLTKIGYGGSLADAGKAIGKSGDGGIDGVIKEDKLGLDLLYIQAKRWDNTTVGRPDIQQFAGALQGKKARKGIFITTSSYSKDAFEYVKNLENRIVLIDGAQLAELMFDHGIGVATANVYAVKRIDSDFFDDEMSSVDELAEGSGQ